MNANIGTLDRIARLLLGAVLLAYALKLGLPETGCNWAGWIGVVPIATALINFCPLYRIIGVSTRG